MAAEIVMRLERVGRAYKEMTRELVILKDADFTLRRGEMVALVAPSGAGKSTLLHTADLLERPDNGDVFLDGRSCSKLSDDERTAVPQRRRFRLSVPPSSAGIFRAGECDAADDPRSVQESRSRACAAAS